MRRPLAATLLLALCGTILSASPAADARRPSASPLGSLLIRPHDLGPGYRELSPGTSTRSGILQPGIPVPARDLQVHAHHFQVEFFDFIFSRQQVKLTAVTVIQEWGDRYATAPDAHWAFVQSRHVIPQRAPLALPVVGSESYGFVPAEGNRPGTAIVFRRGAYLVNIVLYHTPTQPARLVRLARVVDARIQQNG
jgi:hypothetical protein